MKKYLLIIPVLLSLLLLMGVQDRMFVENPTEAATIQASGFSGKGGGIYCPSQSWNTFTDFRFDADHPGGDHIACLSPGMQSGVDNGSGTPTIATPPYDMDDSESSGGFALYCDSDLDQILWDNSPAFVQPKWGEIRIKFLVTNNVTENTNILDIVGDSTNYILFRVALNGTISMKWKDHGDSEIAFTGLDTDSFIGDWIELHMKWDCTACQLGDGNCGAINEIGVRWRHDGDGDGAWNGPGAAGNGYWSNWTYESSSNDIGDPNDGWTTAPGADDVRMGFAGALGGSWTFYIDDYQISYSQPASMDNP